MGPTLVARMIAPLCHRGPDDEGIWVDGPVGLGSRRLAVIDLSSRAHQPMVNEDGNFHALRAELAAKGHPWDARRRTLFLARDRLGKEPLFSYHDGRRFLFGSAPKAILQDPAIRAEADPKAIHHCW